MADYTRMKKFQIKLEKDDRIKNEQRFEKMLDTLT